MKLCLICSAGGHLTQMLQLQDLYKKHNYFFVIFKREYLQGMLRDERVTFVKDPGRNPIKFLVNIFQSLRILLKEVPDVIISTGAGMAIPMCYLGKILKKKIIFIESFSRIEKPSLSGRMVYPIADLFIIQWKSLQRFYPRAIYGGTNF